MFINKIFRGVSKNEGLAHYKQLLASLNSAAAAGQVGPARASPRLAGAVLSCCAR